MPAPAHLPVAPGDPGAAVRVHPLLCGRFKSPSQWFHRERGRRGTLQAFGVGATWLDAPFVAYLVEHPRVGPFLIDTGLTSTIADRTRYRDSLAQLQAYAKSEACVVLIPGHDIAAWRALRPVYQR